MVATRGAGIVAANGCDRGTVGKINRSALHLGFALQLGVVLDNAFHSAKHPGQGLLKIVGKDQNLVGRLLGESPSR